MGVGGKNYRPFLIFAFSFDIPICIVSDNDGSTKEEVDSAIERIREKFDFSKKLFSLEFLGEGNNIESELLGVLQLRREEIIEALVSLKTGDNKRHAEAKRREFNNMGDEDLLKELNDSKPSYAGFLSDMMIKNQNGKKMIPDALTKTFERIEGWMEQ